MLEGGVDDLGRPLVRVRMSGLEDELLCIVDTGYNGDIWMSTALAAACQLKLSTVVERAEVASGAEIAVRSASATIEWLGDTRTVLVHVAGPVITAVRSRRSEGTGHALLGVGLLRQTLLVANFPREHVQITAAT